MNTGDNPRSVEFRFTPGHVSAFMAISRDRNPLHVDAGYARRTQFGRPVVYGVSGVLAGLGAWAQGRPFALDHIRAQFQRPLFVGDSCTISITESPGQADIQILKGGQLHFRMSFGWQEPRPMAASSRSSKSGFQPLPEAKEWDGARDAGGTFPPTFAYEPDWAAAKELEKWFGLGPSQMPAGQLSALLCSSYFVGMEAPGRQALFVDLDFAFENPATGENHFELRDVKLDYDARYHRLAISGRGTGIRSFQLNAFQRPGAVRYEMEKVRSAIKESADFSGKNVFLTGGSRGFGEVLSKAFVLGGASLALNYRSGEAEARGLEKELSQVRAGTLLVPGDVAKEADCERMRDEVFARFGRLDFLVCNAFPHLETKPFLAQTPAEFLDTVQRYVAVSSKLLYFFLPRLEAGATVVLVSTIATTVPEKQYSHYVAAKSALEGLVRVLAKEFKSLRFVILRPPRMLTDLTNLPYSLAGPVSAVEVAARALKALRELETGRNLFEVDL